MNYKMKVIISPAKKMNIDTDTLPPMGLPVYLDKTKMIMEWLKELDLDALRSIWKCSDKIAELNFKRLQFMDLEHGLTPAILSYEGIQYQYMAPAVFEDSQFSYIQESLRILSGFYGILKPMDGVTPYRLEMQAKVAIGETKNLYQFWKDCLYQEIIDDSHVIINLASKEYARCVEAYLQPEDRYITCIFGEIIKGKVVQKGTYAKMARGEMVRFMAENQVKNPEKLKEFDGLGYQFRENFSNENCYVFIK